MAVDTNKAIKILSDLIHLDVDAIHAYDQAIDHIDVVAIKDRIIEFRDDHERHVTDLSAEIRRLGGEPPKRGRDLKGFFLEGFTAVRAATGTEGALKAMHTNEELTNRRYQDALDSGLPAEALDVVRRNREDERRHLAFIDQVLRDKMWEQPPPPPA